MQQSTTIILKFPFTNLLWVWYLIFNTKGWWSKKSKNHPCSFWHCSSFIASWGLIKALLSPYSLILKIKLHLSNCLVYKTVNRWGLSISQWRKEILVRKQYLYLLIVAWQIPLARKSTPKAHVAHFPSPWVYSTRGWEMMMVYIGEFYSNCSLYLCPHLLRRNTSKN